jgi:hypothetical protein
MLQGERRAMIKRLACLPLVFLWAAAPSGAQPQAGIEPSSRGIGISAAPHPDAPSELWIRSAGEGEIRVPVSGPGAVAGAVEAAQPILSLDASLDSRVNALSQNRQRLVVELRELAAVQLRQGLDLAQSANGGAAFPAAELRQIRYLTQAAWTTSTRPGSDRVRTYISGPDSSWQLTYVSLEDRHRHDLEWQPYTYGNALDIKTYVFRLRGTAGGTTECERSVPVWDDPTRYILSCQ